MSDAPQPAGAPSSPSSGPSSAAGTEPAAGLSRRTLFGRTAVLAAAGAATAVTGTGIAGAAVPGQRGNGPAFVRTAARTRVSPDLPSPSAVLASGRRLVDYEVVEFASLLQSGAVSSVEILQAYVDRINAFNGPFEVYADNGGYNAFIRLDLANAMAAAKAADGKLAAARAAGTTLPYLTGIPFGIKDSVAVKGLSTQDGTPAFLGNLALQDAVIVARLRAAGAVILGQTLCTAFSGAITGPNTGNAWNKAYEPGGSSGGSGCAAVARLVAATIGEETGGSIICPSAANGATGIKPSLGLSPTAGLMPLSPGYDVLGPIVRSARDASLILATILGPDGANDPFSLIAPNPFPAMPLTARPGPKPLFGLTIGIPQTDWMRTTAGIQVGVSPQDTYDADHKAVFNRLVGELQSLGATVKTFRGLDVTQPAEDPYFNSTDVLAVIAGSNVSPSSAVLSPNRYEIRYAAAVKDFAADKSPDVQALLASVYGRKGPGEATATFDSAINFTGGIPASVRTQGERRRRQLEINYTKALADAGVDFMLVMTFGAQISKRTVGYANDRAYIGLPNALAWPMTSFPVGYDTSALGLPICAQFWGPRFSEPMITQATIDYQANFPSYNAAAPPDPTVTAPSVRPLGMRDAAPAAVPPELSTDPLVRELAD